MHPHTNCISAATLAVYLIGVGKYRLPSYFISDDWGRARVLVHGRGLAVRVVVYAHISRRRGEGRGRVGVRVRRGYREAGLAFAQPILVSKWAVSFAR